jgi:hypothetical protein
MAINPYEPPQAEKKPESNSKLNWLTASALQLAFVFAIVFAIWQILEFINRNYFMPRAR